MSFFTRPTFICAIVFGCFAVLVPRIFLPFFHPKPSYHPDDRLRRSPPPMFRSDQDDPMEPMPDSPPHIHDAHPHMRMQHPGVNNRELSEVDQSNSKPATTFALPMYTIGIAVFFIFTCFKYWRRRNSEENPVNLQYSTDRIQWSSQKKKFKYQMNNRHHADGDNNDEEENSYAGLDADYVQYLKSKRQEESEAEQTITAEQRQMHHTLDDMKSSLSYISSKLGTTKTTHNLTQNEIAQLQNRLASTEAQMYKILSALDAASTKMNEITKNTRESLEQPRQNFHHEEEHHLSSRSQSESEGSLNDEENSNSDENSLPREEQLSTNKQEEEEEESSSSYEEDDEVPHEIDDDDDESESESDRYGLMNTDYECDPTTVDDYELDTVDRPSEISDNQTKVQKWRERNHSQSLGSSNSSINQDQSQPKEEQSQKQPE